jgi:hypothetical protein
MSRIGITVPEAWDKEQRHSFTVKNIKTSGELALFSLQHPKVKGVFVVHGREHDPAYEARLSGGTEAERQEAVSLFEQWVVLPAFS